MQAPQSSTLGPRHLLLRDAHYGSYSWVNSHIQQWQLLHQPISLPHLIQISIQDLIWISPTHDYTRMPSTVLQFSLCSIWAVTVQTQHVLSADYNAVAKHAVLGGGGVVCMWEGGLILTSVPTGTQADCLLSWDGPHLLPGHCDPDLFWKHHMLLFSADTNHGLIMSPFLFFGLVWKGPKHVLKCSTRLFFFQHKLHTRGILKIWTVVTHCVKLGE